MKPILHLTTNYQLEAADALIKQLKQDLGAANAYIDELAYKNNELEEEVEKLKKQIADKDQELKNFSDKYSRDVNEYLRTDVLYQKYIKVIDEVSQNVIRAQEQNDKLVHEIMKLRYEGNNSQMVC